MLSSYYFSKIVASRIFTETSFFKMNLPILNGTGKSQSRAVRMGLGEVLMCGLISTEEQGTR